MASCPRSLGRPPHTHTHTLACHSARRTICLRNGVPPTQRLFCVTSISDGALGWVIGSAVRSVPIARAWAPESLRVKVWRRSHGEKSTKNANSLSFCRRPGSCRSSQDFLLHGSEGGNLLYHNKTSMRRREQREELRIEIREERRRRRRRRQI